MQVSEARGIITGWELVQFNPFATVASLVSATNIILLLLGGVMADLNMYTEEED